MIYSLRECCGNFSNWVRKVNYIGEIRKSKAKRKAKEVSKGENSAAKNDESFEQALVPLALGDCKEVSTSTPLYISAIAGTKLNKQIRLKSKAE